MSESRTDADPPNLLYLPAGYRENVPISSDATGRPYWTGRLDSVEQTMQEPVYRFARRMARDRGPAVLVDIGCGTGDKLQRLLASAAPSVVGIDQASAITLAKASFPAATFAELDIENDDWTELERLRPELVICADVIEHVDDPVRLLDHLRDVLPPGGRLILSTPDRARLPGPPLGPPENDRHVREWTEAELRRLVASRGLAVEKVRHLLPRRYFFRWREARRCLALMRRGLAVPDRRYSMAFVCRAGGSSADR